MGKARFKNKKEIKAHIAFLNDRRLKKMAENKKIIEEYKKLKIDKKI